MRTLHRHHFADFLFLSAATALVLVFVICVALVFGAADLVAQGVGAAALLKVVILGLPEILPFAIPVSLLTATLLLFGRLSSDGEITALKACGISLWSLISPLLLFSLLMTVLCLWFNHEVVPRNRLRQRSFVHELSEVSPLDFFPAGQTIDDFPGMTLWIERIEDGELFNIRIYDQRDGEVPREIQANRGVVFLEQDSSLMLDLFEVTIDPFDTARPGPAVIGQWTVRITETRQRARYRERTADRESLVLWQEARELTDTSPDGLTYEERRGQAMELRVELNKRSALAVACFAFVLLGMPLGIKAHRQESSVGGAISLAVVLVFYVFLVVAESLRSRPAFRPDLLIWTPVLLSMILGWKLVRRADLG